MLEIAESIGAMPSLEVESTGAMPSLEGESTGAMPSLEVESIGAMPPLETESIGAMPSFEVESSGIIPSLKLESSGIAASLKNLYRSCILCPRSCRVDRTAKQKGFCGCDDEMRVGRSALHFWEEPCISGIKPRGSGAIFFCGCNLHCIYCQNQAISTREGASTMGKVMTVADVAREMLRLQDVELAYNINLVTATQYLPQVTTALRLAKENGLHIPVVYNCGGYESVSALRHLEGLVDIYLPDFKYMDPSRSAVYSHAPDYPEAAKGAIAEMVRQVGDPRFEEIDGMAMMQKGVIVRHLALPGGREDTFAIIRYLLETYGQRIYMSIMKQYTPMREFPDHPELSHRLTRTQYKRIIDYMISLGVENAFIQEGPTARESFIPAFDLK